MDSTLRFCSECGAQLEEDAHFCPECGAAVEIQDSSDSELRQDQTIPKEKESERMDFNPPPPPSSTEKIEPDDHKPKAENGSSKKSHKLLIILGIIFFLILVGGVTYLYVEQQNQAKGEREQAEFEYQENERLKAEKAQYEQDRFEKMLQEEVEQARYEQAKLERSQQEKAERAQQAAERERKLNSARYNAKANVLNRKHAIHPNTYKSKYNSYYPYVCYDKKILSGNKYLDYQGCVRSNTNCKNIGKESFGRYPNDYRASQALKRCIAGTPRFVD